MPSLEITTMVGCPLMCKFCPQDKLKAAYAKAEKYLSYHNFATILAKVPKHVRIDFSGMAEPWANPECTAMLTLALHNGYSVAIYTTLYEMDDPDFVADLLTQHRDQVDVVCLHLPDANGNMRGWRYSPEYEAALRRFFALKGVLPRLEVMTMDGSGKVAPELAHVGIYLEGWAGHSRAANIVAPDGQAMEVVPAHEGAVMCSYTPFYDQSVLLADGSVVLCCMDYSLQHKLGNLLEQDYYDIFAGPEMGALRAENMRPEFSSRSLCRTCNRARKFLTGPAKATA
jgi:hypothetical protein